MSKPVRTALNWLFCIVSVVSMMLIIVSLTFKSLLSKPYATKFFSKNDLATIRLPLGKDGGDVTVARLISGNLPAELQNSEYFEFDSEAVKQMIRRSKLDRLIVNAVSNAGKYFSNGAVELLYSEEAVLELLDDASEAIYMYSGGYNVDAYSARLVNDYFEKSASHYDTVPKIAASLSVELGLIPVLTSTWCLVLLFLLAIVNLVLIFVIERLNNCSCLYYLTGALIGIGIISVVVYTVFTVLIANISMELLSDYTANALACLLIGGIIITVAGCAASIIVKLLPGKHKTASKARYPLINVDLS